MELANYFQQQINCVCNSLLAFGSKVSKHFHVICRIYTYLDICKRIFKVTALNGVSCIYSRMFLKSQEFSVVKFGKPGAASVL